MSDLDYYTGKALENDYIAQQRANANLNQQLGRLEQQRSSALQGAAINNEKLMKYLPQQLKAAGMSNLGVAQSSYIRQANNYASERGAINQSFNNAMGDVMSAYADAQAQRDIARNNAITDLEKYYGEKADATAKEEKTKLENSVKNMVNNGIAGKLTKEEILAEVSGYQNMLDPVVWDEIMSAINSGEHLRLEGEKDEAEEDSEKATAKADSAILSSTFENMTQEQFDAWLAQFPNASQEAIALAKEKYRLVQNGELTAEQEKKDNEFLSLMGQEYATAEEMQAAFDREKEGVSDYAVKLAQTWLNKFKADEGTAATDKADSSMLDHINVGSLKGKTQEEFDEWLAQFPNASQEMISLAKEIYKQVSSEELTAEQEKKDNEFLSLMGAEYATAEEMQAAFDREKEGVSDYAVKLAQTWLNKKGSDEEKLNATALAGSLEMRVYDGIASGYSKEQLQALIDPYKGQIDQRVWDDLQEMINADEAMDAATLEAKRKEIANDNIDFYITNGLYKNDSHDEIMAWMEENAADADDHVFKRALAVYEDHVENMIEEEDKQAGDEKRTNADAMISEIIGSFTGTPDELANELAPYMDNASELAKEYAEYYQRIYRTDYEEVEEIEKDTRVLDGTDTLEYNGETWRITGEETPNSTAYGEKFRAALFNETGISDPYSNEINNGTTIKVNKQNFTYYNGKWYPSSNVATVGENKTSTSAGNTSTGSSTGNTKWNVMTGNASNPRENNYTGGR